MTFKMYGIKRKNQSKEQALDAVAYANPKHAIGCLFEMEESAKADAFERFGKQYKETHETFEVILTLEAV
jgi:hypothetical protein